MNLNHQALKINVDENSNEVFSRVFLGVLESMYKFGNPENLPIEKIEDFLKYAKNDIEWISVKSLIDLRERAENLQLFSYNDLVLIARNHKIVFWEEQVARDIAEDVINKNDYVYISLIEELERRAIEEEQKTGSDDLIDFVKSLESMTAKEVLENIHPGYSLHIATEYVNKSDVSSNLFMTEDNLRSKIKDLVKTNPEVFHNVFLWEKTRDSFDNLIGDNFNEYNIAPQLFDFSKEEGYSTRMAQFTYAGQSTVTPIAKDTLVLHSPNGRLLGAFDSREKMKKKFTHSGEIMKMSYFLSYENVSNEKYSQTDIALTASLAFWDCIPENVREAIIYIFDCHDFSELDLSKIIKYVQENSFMVALNVISQYNFTDEPQLIDKVNNFVAEELTARFKEPSPHFIDSAEYLESINNEYGKTEISESEMDGNLLMLNFHSIKFLKDNLDLDMSLLSRKEFFSLILFLKNHSHGDGFNKIKNFIGDIDNQSDKINRVKSFLSLEIGGEGMGDKIISIDENTKNNPGLADKIFAKYAEIVGDAYGIEDRARGEFDKKDIGKDELAIISRSLLEKGKGILEEYADKLADGKEIDEQQILNDLGSCKANLLLTASIWKGINKDSVKLEDLKGVTFERYTTDKLAEMPNVFRLVREAISVDGVIMPAIHAQSVKSSINSYENEASEEEKQRAQEIIEMIRIYQKNYENYPELRDKIVPGFLEKLESGRGDIAIYLYKKDGKVMAFNRFDDNGDGTKYFGSCNVDPTLSGSAIGGALARETLEREAGGAQKIKGDCIPGLPISSYYVEDSGFIATGITKDYGGTGVDLMQIERVAENGKYYYRDKEIDIVGAYKDNPDNKLKTDEPRFVLKYKIGSGDLNRVFEELGPKDYVMTRYCFDKEGGEVYCGFERRV